VYRDESNGTIPSSPRLSSLQLQLPRARSIEVETLPFMDAQPNSSNNIHGQNHQVRIKLTFFISLFEFFLFRLLHY